MVFQIEQTGRKDIGEPHLGTQAEGLWNAWFQHQSSVATPDFELLRLEEALRLAETRLFWMRRSMPDPAALKAAEDLCAEAAAAMATYQATHPAAYSSKAATTLARRR